MACCAGFSKPLSAQSNLQIRSILNPHADFCSFSRLEKLRFMVQNVGSSSIADFIASYKYGQAAWQSESFNSPLSPNQSLPFEFSQPIMFQSGIDTLVLAVSNGQAPTQNTDTLHFYFNANSPVNLPYFENFELPNQLASTCVASRGSASAIVMDYPFGSNNPTKKLLVMTASRLIPIFNTQVPADVWDEAWNPEYLSVKSIRVNHQGTDSLCVRFKLLQLAGGTNPDQLLSFFRVLVNGIQIGPTLQASGPGQSFQTYDWAIDSLQLGTDRIIVEFQAKNRYLPLGPPLAVNGCLVDEVVVYNKRPNGVQMRQLDMSVPLPMLGDQLQLHAQLRNHGVDTLRSVWMYHNAQSSPDSQLFMLNLPFMRDTTLVFSRQIQAQDQPLCVRHGHLNGQAVSQADTLCEQLPALKSVAQLPYCDNFEGSQQLWVPVHSESLRYGGSWISGLPQKQYVQGSTSGTNTWYTGPDSNYRPHESSALYGPVIQVTKDSCYRISFKANWMFDFFQNNPTYPPLWGDGFTIEMQNQLGNWQTMGSVDTVNMSWYNNMVFALRDITQSPINMGLGWTGGSMGQYYTQEQVFKAPFSGDLKLRFRFASDDVGLGEGAAIDDFCFELASCADLPASIRAQKPLEQLRLYPNPSGAQTTLAFALTTPSLVESSIRNMQGQLVYSHKSHLEAGSHALPLQLPDLPAGVYFVQLQAGEQVQFLRWIKY